MATQLKCALLLSLRELSLRKVAVLLWNSFDSLDTVSKFKYNIFSPDESKEEWRDTLETEIRDKMSELDLPESLMNDMIEIIRPIGLEIRKWVDIHEDYFLDSYDQSHPPDLTKLCWTAAGAIDNRKTAEKLVRCDVLEIDRRYHLACLYCLEDDIPLIWVELPEWKKIHYYNHKPAKPNLSFCWPCIFKGKLSNLDYLLRTSNRNPFTFYQCAFEHFAKNGKKTAAEYFFLKLSHEEREDSLARTFHKVLAAIKNIDVFEYLDEFPKEKYSRLFFLVSLMNPEQQMEIAMSEPISVLFSFLDWPWQDLFLENAGLFWTLIPPSSYGNLLNLMNDRYTITDLYIPKLFREFLLQSPLCFKKIFVNQENELNYSLAHSFLSLLFDSEDSETIRVIFRNLDAADRTELLFHDDVLEELYERVMAGRFRLVNVCLQETSLSKEDRERLKKTLLEFLESDDSEENNFEKRNLDFFFQLLDESDVRTDQRNKRRLKEYCHE